MSTFTIALHSPLHHGAGSAGNTSLLRTEEVVTPDGRSTAVPFVSGNSLRHQIREALAWDLITTLGVEEGSLSKAATDLLFSGGAVTTTGAQVDLGMQRRVEEHLPMLNMLGYAALSDIIPGTLRVQNLILVCSENAWRLPPEVAELPQAGRAAAAYRGEEFGTRHDTAGGPVDKYVDLAAGVTGTSQMIYDMQVLKAGSVLSGGLTFTPAATAAHREALDAAMSLLTPDGVIRLGAKTAVGYGSGHCTYTPGQGALTAWREHLTAHRDEALSIIEELGR